MRKPFVRILTFGTLLALGASLLVSTTALVSAANAPSPGWTVAGGDIHNTRDGASEHFLSTADVWGLWPHWTFTAKGNLPATPTVANGIVYAPDLAGNLWAIGARTGSIVWSRTIASYTGISGDASRDSPAVAGDVLVTGDGTGTTNDNGAYLLGIDALTGSLLWKTEIDTNPLAIVTSSPVVDNGVAYVGVSSKTEVTLPNPCCTFRGSVVAVQVSTGRILWKTYTVPNNDGQPDEYSGNAVWGSTPVVDNQTGYLYVGTGNNYTVPAGICTEPNQTGCTQPPADDYQDSVLALSLRTGNIEWAMHTLTSDTFRLACIIPGTPCGPDFDFGSGPNLYTTSIGDKSVTLLGIGQKSGEYWALDPSTGKVVWHTLVGPGSLLGGIEWGSATDGTRIYVADANTLHASYTITAADGTKSSTNAGFWTALDAANGNILWQTADPQGQSDEGFVSTANGVVYASSEAPSGPNMYALDAATGAIDWSFASSGAVIGGAAILNGQVYWGSGYPSCGINISCGVGDKLYDFSFWGF